MSVWNMNLAESILFFQCILPLHEAYINAYLYCLSHTRFCNDDQLNAVHGKLLSYKILKALHFIKKQFVYMLHGWNLYT